MASEFSQHVWEKKTDLTFKDLLIGLGVIVSTFVANNTPTYRQILV